MFRAKAGQTCVEPGRKQGAKVGDFAPDGRFAPYPIDEGGSCTDLSMVPAGAQLTQRPNENRTTVHGVAGPKVRLITLTVEGVSQELTIGRRGAFFAVLDGLFTPDGLDVSATLQDGSVVSLLSFSLATPIDSPSHRVRPRYDTVSTARARPRGSPWPGTETQGKSISRPSAIGRRRRPTGSRRCP